MFNSFKLRTNWYVKTAPAVDSIFVDRSGEYTLGVTDPLTHTVYLSEDLQGILLTRVLIHEIAHCCMIDYNLIEMIHRMCKPRYWVEAEEWVCNFIADYGILIFQAAYSVLGEDALDIVPYELEVMFK